VTAPARTATHDRILQATVQTLAERGYAGTTARTIAATGGFAPGVIYYHFTDLDDLFVAASNHISGDREARYRAAVTGVTRATVVVERLRVLYAEDADSGHIEAIQELIAAARPGSPLAAAVAEQTRRWESLTEQVLRALLRGTPLARLVSAPVTARAVVAYYLGMQTLTHIDGDAERPRTAFVQAARLAVAFDRLPRLRRKSQATPR
jgi:AcrR family transcriptional regulator